MVASVSGTVSSGNVTHPTHTPQTTLVSYVRAENFLGPATHREAQRIYAARKQHGSLIQRCTHCAADPDAEPGDGMQLPFLSEARQTMNQWKRYSKGLQEKLAQSGYCRTRAQDTISNGCDRKRSVLSSRRSRVDGARPAAANVTFKDVAAYQHQQGETLRPVHDRCRKNMKYYPIAPSAAPPYALLKPFSNPMGAPPPPVCLEVEQLLRPGAETVLANWLEQMGQPAVGQLRGGKGSLKPTDKVGESIGAWRIRQRAGPAMLGKGNATCVPGSAAAAAAALAECESGVQERGACFESRNRAHTAIMRAPVGSGPFYWVCDRVRR